MKVMCLLAVVLVFGCGLSGIAGAEEANVPGDGIPNDIGDCVPVGDQLGPKYEGGVCDISEEDLPDLELTEGEAVQAKQQIGEALEQALGTQNEGESSEIAAQSQNQVNLPELPEEAGDEARAQLREKIQERVHASEDAEAQGVIDAE